MISTTNTQAGTLYSNSSLATKTFYREIVELGHLELGKIYTVLPPNSEAAINFFITANDQHTQAKIFYSIAMHIRKLATNHLTITCANYTKEACQKASSTCEREIDPSLDRYPLITELVKEHALDMNALTRIPCAYTIVQLVQQMFKEGIPCPRDQVLRRYYFEVIVKTVSAGISFYECLELSRQSIPSCKDVGFCIGIYSPHLPDSFDRDRLLKILPGRFDRLRQEAEGKRPKELPLDAKINQIGPALNINTCAPPAT